MTAVAVDETLTPVGLIRLLLPPEAVAVDVFGDIAEDGAHPEARLFPEEAAAIAPAVPRRRREFVTVRACARRALAGLGLPPVALVPGERGAPGWPAGVVGSMTHCDGYRAAAVVWAEHAASVGIDAEPGEQLPPRVLETVTLEAERAHLAALARIRPDIPWDRLLFSAKESVYKAWFPLTGIWLGFDDARIEFALADEPDGADDGGLDDPVRAARSADSAGPRAHGSFVARLLVPGPRVDGRTRDRFTGLWLVRDGIAATGVTVERQSQDAPAGTGPPADRGGGP